MSTPIPGLEQPMVKPLLAGNPRDSAIVANNQQAQSQANLAKAVGGKKRRRRGGGTIPAPQMQISYPVSGAGDQNPNDIMQRNAQISTQAASYRQFDNQARVTGGSKKRGGSVKWGCYSGGKKTKSRRHRTKRKSHKKKRTNTRRR